MGISADAEVEWRQFNTVLASSTAWYVDGIP